MELHYLYGKPEAAADFKRQPEDFIVDEILDIELTGEGEHVCLHIIKKQINTLDVAKKIAKQAGTHVKNVSYAGLKDRHGVCSQWFSVPVPIKKGVDFTELNDDFIFVAKQKRHNRKLRTGCHSGNRFTITLRNIDKPLDILSRINAVRQGVPNYFGEQRFGHDGHNLTMAERMFSGEHIRDRKLRSIVISAARSHIFNQLVSMRVEEHGLAKTWHREIFMLEGSNAFFEDDISDENIARLTSGDICLSAPLVGKGEKGLIAQEKQFLEAFSAWHHGLAELGLKNERRALRLIPIDLEVKTLSSDSIELRFALPKGTFATAVLRELVNYVDVNKNAFANKEER